MKLSKTLLGVAALSALSLGARAQVIIPLYIEDQDVLGLGLVEGIQTVAINNDGTWLVELDLSGSTATDEIVMRGGINYQREGGPVAAPVGAAYNSLQSMDLRQDGVDTIVWTLNGTPGGTADNSGIYRNSQLVLQKGSTPLAAGWGLGTVYRTLSTAKSNLSNQVYVIGNCDDPTLGAGLDAFASIVQLDGANVPISETVLARAGDIMPGTGFPMNLTGTSPLGNAFNASGQAIFRVSLTGGAPGTADAAIYMWDGVMLNLLAADGGASPVAARPWSDLLAPEVDINDAGDWAIKDVITLPSNDIIVINNAKFMQQGDTIPAIAGFTFSDFANSPITLTSTGTPCWWADWTDPVTTMDTGVFVGTTLVLQEGVTSVNGLIFNSFGTDNTSGTGGQQNIHISRNGRYVIFTGQLENGTDDLLGAFVLDLLASPPNAYCFGDGSGTACPCTPVPLVGDPDKGCPNSFNAGGGKLSATGTASVTFDSLVLTCTLINNGGAVIFQGTNDRAGGLGTAFGDGLRCAAGTVMRMKSHAVTTNSHQYPDPMFGDNAISVRGAVLVPGDRYYQGWYRSGLAHCDPTANYNTTNALKITWLP